MSIASTQQALHGPYPIGYDSQPVTTSNESHDPSKGRLWLSYGVAFGTAAWLIGSLASSVLDASVGSAVVSTAAAGSGSTVADLIKGYVMLFMATGGLVGVGVVYSLRSTSTKRSPKVDADEFNFFGEGEFERYRRDLIEAA